MRPSLGLDEVDAPIKEALPTDKLPGLSVTEGWHETEWETVGFPLGFILTFSNGQKRKVQHLNIYRWVSENVAELAEGHRSAAQFGG